MKVNQSFRDSSEAFAKAGGAQERRRGYEDCIADRGGWALEELRETDRTGPDRGSQA